MSVPTDYTDGGVPPEDLSIITALPSATAELHFLATPVPPVEVDFPGISPRQFTIGIEIEMIIPGLVAEQRFQGNCYEFVAQALKRLAKEMGVEMVVNESWRVEFDKFQIKPDLTIVPKGFEYRDATIEIATPILRNEDWKWVVPRVCESMRCAAQFAGTRLVFNESTELHVHTAVSGRAFTVPELKKISKAVILFEEHMAHFHPKCRRKNSFDLFTMEACRDSDELQRLSYEDAFDRIDKGKDLDDVIYNVNGYALQLELGLGKEKNRETPLEKLVSRGFRVNFTNLTKTGTIEFRQAMGTDNEVFILDWIKAIIKFITAAIKTPDQLFVDWSRNGIPHIVHSVYGVPKLPKYRIWGKKPPVQRSARETFALSMVENEPR